MIRNQPRRGARAGLVGLQVAVTLFATSCAHTQPAQSPPRIAIGAEARTAQAQQQGPQIVHFRHRGKILGGKVSVLQGFGATIEAHVPDPGTEPLVYTWTIDGKVVAARPYNWYPYLPAQPGTFELVCTLGLRDGTELSRKALTIEVRPI